MNEKFNTYYSTIHFSNKIFVKCPKCNNIGKITTNFLTRYTIPYCSHNFESKFVCLTCCHMINSKDNKWYGKFIGCIGEYHGGLACRVCGSKVFKILAPTNKIYKTTLVRCSTCNQEKEYEINWSNYIKDEAYDPYFGLELILKFEIKDNVIWFYNFEHLNYIKTYLLSNVKDDTKAYKYSLIFKLPKFVKLAKNKDYIIKSMLKLEKNYVELR